MKVDKRDFHGKHPGLYPAGPNLSKTTENHQTPVIRNINASPNRSI